MKIILRQDVENLGKMGELVTVKDGYGRNFLIPRQFAYYASDSAVKKLEVEKKQYLKKYEQMKLSAEALASKISELQVSIPMKVGEEGRLFGTVTPAAIAKELILHGYEIDRRNITIEEPIKTLGVFTVKVKLHQEVTSPLKVWVISEE
ncbi:MAG: 50S ribosomal protein L9 [Candidatus Kapaibacteriota bacterium]|jgi:large subunit ribosomal protein L9